MRKKSLHDYVGDWLEGVFKREYPDFSRVEDDKTNGKVPDFHNGQFWVEVKNGFWDYGVQPKKKQILNFSPPDGSPLVYFLGFHNLRGLSNIFPHLREDEKTRYLEERMGLNYAYFVNGKVMKSIWSKDHRVAKQNPEWAYLSLKPRTLRQIINDEQIKRKNALVCARSYYGLSNQLVAHISPDLNGAKSNFSVGFILNEDSDPVVIEYLKNTRKVDISLF